LVPDAAPPEDARLPWYTIAATAAAGALSGTATLLVLGGGLFVHHPSYLGLAAGIGALVAAALGAALWIADWLAAHRWRPLSWAVALAVPWVVVAALGACLNRTGGPLVWMLAPLVTGPALGAVAPARRFLPWLLLAVGVLTGGLCVLAMLVLEATLRGGGIHAPSALNAGLALALGTTLFGPFGLAVGLCLDSERRRAEQRHG
jgi:hypothetical protein